MRFLRSFCIASAIAFSLSASAADLAPRAKTAPEAQPFGALWPGMRVSQINRNSDWTFGFDGGLLARQKYIDVTLLRPWAPRFDGQSKFVEAQAIYTAYRFSAIPANLEIEMGASLRFGRGTQPEIYALPVLRWKYFPWNDYLYTNLRVGLLGPSYAFSLSNWERQNARNGGRGSHFMNVIISELTFAPGPTSPWEGFVRVHHRSGGRIINKAGGGSNYVGLGLRYHMPNSLAAVTK